MIGLALNVFVLEKHREAVSGVARGKHRAGTYGNKGAVALSLALYGKRLRFVNLHLAPHDGNLFARLRQYNAVKNGLRESEDVADFEFWLGDLNFRLVEPGAPSGDEIVEAAARGELQRLLAKDELLLVRAAGDAFEGYSEQAVTFPPTFKFHPGGDEYNLKRRPAWTDRILYKGGEALRPLSYTSMPSYNTSDHKPVTAQFLIELTDKPTV